ncbi:acetolactate synthase catalytic subunit, partial [Rhizobium leguminosarum]
RQVPRSASVIHIDVDPTEIGRNYEAVRLAGDAAETISALRSVLARRDLSYRSSQRSKLTARIAGFWRAFDTERQSVARSDK